MAGGNIRKKITKEVEAQVLAKSLRRCCLCFAINNDPSEKKGQIAHIDKDPANNKEENLSFLCLEHHSEYDSTTSQNKNYTQQELKQYKSQLHKAVLNNELNQNKTMNSGDQKFLNTGSGSMVIQGNHQTGDVEAGASGDILFENSGNAPMVIGPGTYRTGNVGKKGS